MDDAHPTDKPIMVQSWSIRRSILVGFAFMLSLMGLSALLSILSMQRVLAVQNEHALGILPAARLADTFQREMLNARISLIYYITIQKPGSRDLGIKHLHLAESTLAEFAALVDSRSELADMQSPARRLQAELKAYAIELGHSFDLVGSGVHSGPAYDAQIKTWAQTGTILVDEADKTQVLSASLSNSRNQTNIESLQAIAMIDESAFGVTLLAGIVLGGIVIRRINSSLRSVGTDLDESSSQIKASAADLASASHSLARNSAQQAATIEEASAASTEINSMAHRTAENSDATAAIVSGAQSGFDKTNQALDEMAAAMEAISSSSIKVAKVIKVIDDIAFQTNILALNAAVEAARAGDEGLGFAVVAEEVRTLAQRCASAAKDTTSLIEESLESSRSGKEKMERVADGIHTITLESGKIKELVEEMKLGGIEQTRGIHQINQAIQQMEQVTQSSAAQAEQGAAAASQLNGQADSMHNIVVRLKTMIEGNQAAA